MNIWENECHRTVDWKLLEDHFLVEKPGWARFSELVLVLFVAPLLVAVAGGIAVQEYGIWRKRHQERREEEEEAEVLRSMLFPFGEAELFVGPRYHWMEKKDKKVSRNDIKALGDHLKGVIYAICSFIRRKPAVKITEDKIDFSKPLIASGGPIPNWYTRNLMYGGDIDLPYKFRLDVTEELRRMSPEGLREAGVKVGKEEPRWVMADRLGNIPKINGMELKPVFSGTKCIRDYFMIIRARNIHPANKGNTPCLILAGCHGPGTAAAGLAVKKLEILREINKKARGYFQAIGDTAVQRRKPVENTIRLLDVEILH